MFALVLIALAVVAGAAVLGRLAAVVRGDRPLTAPRSHFHELDPQSARLRGVI